MEAGAGYEPLEVSDVFQAETTLPLKIDFNISCRDIQTWTDFLSGCVALHGTRRNNIKGLLEHVKEDQVGGHRSWGRRSH